MVRGFQEINSHYLWGGHLVRPCLRAGETPTPQEVVEYFYLGVPKRMFFWGIWRQFSEILGSV